MSLVSTASLTRRRSDSRSASNRKKNRKIDRRHRQTRRQRAEPIDVAGATPEVCRRIRGSFGGRTRWHVASRRQLVDALRRLPKVETEADSIDVIVTDPPYTKEGIPLFGDLSRFAESHLKPGGLCIAYAGKFFLPEEIHELSCELEWVWLMTIIQTSHPSRVHHKKILGMHRPVLVFSKGEYKPDQWMRDTITSTQKPEKELHRWQQALDPVKQIIAMASKPGDSVCDPFGCTGTTGIAAVGQDRSFIGFEINPKTARIGVNRIRQFVKSQKKY